MPTLSSYFAILTWGGQPKTDLLAPKGASIGLLPMAVPKWGPHAALFGRCAAAFRLEQPTHAHLLWMTKEVRGGAHDFFAQSEGVLRHAAAGVKGWGIDVLNLRPFPLAAADQPFELLPEDLFSMGFEERAGRTVAHTYGL